MTTPQEMAFINASQRTFKDQPATLTHADWMTLQAMGLALFQLGEGATTTYPGVLRDATLATWLATRSTAEKKSAFRNPTKAIDTAFDWFDSECESDSTGMAECFGGLLEDKVNASVKPEQAAEDDGQQELPP